MMRAAWFGSGLVVIALAATAACGSDDSSGGSGGGGAGGTAASGGAGGSTGGTGAAGSGGSTGGAAGAGGSTGGAAGTGGADGGATVTFSGTVTEFQAAGGKGKPIAGVQLCLKDATTPPCATTDADGKFTMPGMPANTEGVLLLTKTGYVNVAIVGTTDTTDVVITPVMPTEAVGQVFATAAGFTWPLAGKSIIGFSALEQVSSDAGADAGMVSAGVSGASMSITPTAGKGPVYLGASGLPDKTATATSSAGAGFFGDLPPGEYTMKITPPSGKTCARGKHQGWAASSTDSVKVPAIADFVISALFFDCL